LKTDRAIAAYDEYRALGEKEKLIPNMIDSYYSQGIILAENGNPAEGMNYYKKANDLVEKSVFPEADKENLITGSILYHIYFLTAMGELDKATKVAEDGKLKVESRNNTGEKMFLNTFLGYLELKKGNNDKAIQYLSNTWIENPWGWYYTGLAYKNKGDQANANKFFEKITAWNVNSMPLALVRNRAAEELKK